MSVGRITKNASALFVGKVITSILGFISSMVIARLLEPSELGLIGIAMSTVVLLYTATDLGLNQTVIYLIPRLLKKEMGGKVKYLINKVYLTKIVLGVAITFLLYFSSDWIAILYNEPALGHVLRMFSLLFVFFVLFYSLLELFTSFQKMFYIMYSNIVLSVSKFIPILLFFFAGFIGMLYGYVVLYIISALFAFGFFLKLYPKERKRKKVTWREIGNVSTGMFVMMVCYTITAQASNLMIGLLSTATEVAYFNISTTLGILVSFGAVALGSAMRPAVTDIASKGSKDMVRRIMKYTIYSTLPIASLALALGTPIIRFVYTEKYMLALPAYNWIILSFCLSGIFNVFFNLALSLGRSFSVTKSYSSQTIILLVLSFLLIPTEGAVGAGKAFFVSIVTGGVVMIIETRSFKINYPIKALVLSLISSALMFLVVLAFWNVTYGLYKLVLLSAISLSVYLSTIYLMGGLDPEDIKLLKRFFSAVMKR